MIASVQTSEVVAKTDLSPSEKSLIEAPSTMPSPSLPPEVRVKILEDPLWVKICKVRSMLK